MPGNPFAELLTRIDRLERALEERSIEVPVWGDLVREDGAASCAVRRSTGQSINSGSLTAISYDTELHDTAGMWASGNPTRLVAPVDGFYVVTASLGALAAQVTSAFRFGLYLRVSGSRIIAAGGDPYTTSGADSIRAVAGGDWLTAGEYVEVLCFHVKGSALTLTTTTATAQHGNQARMVQVR